MSPVVTRIETVCGWFTWATRTEAMHRAVRPVHILRLFARICRWYELLCYNHLYSGGHICPAQRCALSSFSVVAAILNLSRSAYIHSRAYRPILVQSTSNHHYMNVIALSSAHAQGPQATLTISHIDDLTVSAIREAMPFPPVRPVEIARTSSDREKTLPRAPGPVTRTASEPAATRTVFRAPNLSFDARSTELRGPHYALRAARSRTASF
jgi:hypothetical protein